jgi:uncharacterized membrane protein
MSPVQHIWEKEKVGQIIGNLLRIGVVMAAALVLIGGVTYLIRHGGEITSYQLFRGEPENLRSVSGIASNAATFHGRGLIQLGLLVLIATPVARVIFSVFVFAKQRDRTFVVITLIVLSVLIFSLFWTHN